MNDIQVQPKATHQGIKLIQGTFTPSEASDILIEIIDKKINFHKIQKLKISEGNHDDPCSLDTARLSELERSKQHLLQIIRGVRADGKRMTINATINIEVVD